MFIILDLCQIQIVDVELWVRLHTFKYLLLLQIT